MIPAALFDHLLSCEAPDFGHVMRTEPFSMTTEQIKSATDTERCSWKSVSVA